jgi:hypothetical protein
MLTGNSFTEKRGTFLTGGKYNIQRYSYLSAVYRLGNYVTEIYISPAGAHDAHSC